MITSQEHIYHQRIDRVIQYVRNHLEHELPLETLAHVAGFSPFHFHRIFKMITDETINDLVLRLRLERAVALLRANPRVSISEAAFRSGFNSVAVFSRAFKRQYQQNASEWDRQSPLKYSKNHQPDEQFPRYTSACLEEFAEQAEFAVQIRTLPAQRLAYVRSYDSYSNMQKIVDAYQRILSWFIAHGGDLGQTTIYGMSQDDPDITPARLCRFDWCFRVPDHWPGAGDIQITTLPACQVATIHMKGDIAHEDRALQYLFRYWLPNSRYQPANLPAMEIYHQPPHETGWQSFDIDCAIPIEPLL
jgi:AraC family transcriptional regulator